MVLCFFFVEKSPDGTTPKAADRFFFEKKSGRLISLHIRMAKLDGTVIPVHRRLYTNATKQSDIVSTLTHNRGIYRTNVRKLELAEEVGALRQQLALAKEEEALWEDSVSCSRRDVNRQQDSLAQLRQSVFIRLFLLMYLVATCRTSLISRVCSLVVRPHVSVG